MEANVTDLDISRADGLAPLVKVPTALMHIDNLSRASLARSTRGVGVTDLREALEGRNSMSNSNLRETAASISTLDHTSATHADGLRLTPVRSRTQQRSKLAGPGEVKDVLNKLGIGKANGAGMLRPSFATKKPEQRYV
jgi:protein EFR3